MRNFVTFTPHKFYSGNKINSSEREEISGIYRNKCIGIKPEGPRPHGRLRHRYGW
jgi:hypothetical protein